MIDARSGILFAAFALATTTARADDVSTDEDVCNGRELGEACRFDGGEGFCRETTCSGIDYSSGKPKAVERSCRRCVAGTPKPSRETKAEPETKPEVRPEAKPEAKVEAKPEVEPPLPETKEAVPAAIAPPPPPTKATTSETKVAPAASTPAKTEPAPAPASKSCAVDPAPASLASVALGVVLLVLARRRSP